MGGIGEYIHYQRQHYYETGTQRGVIGDKKAAFQATKIFATQRDVIRSQARKKTFAKDRISVLQQKLQNLWYPKINEEQKRKEYYDELDTKVLKLVGDQLLGYVVDYENGGSVRKQALGQESGFHMSTVDNIYNQLQKHLANLNLNKGIKDVDKKIQQIENLIKQLNALKNQSLVRTGKNNDFVNFTKSDKSTQSLVTDINVALAELRSVNNINVLIGAVGEAMAAVLDDRLPKEVERWTIDQIQKVITGTQRSTHMKMANSSKTLNPDVEISFSGDIMSTFKMDVNLNYDDDEYRVSMKNYYAGDKSVHILSNASFLNLLRRTTIEDFINHYLNITTSIGYGRNNDADLTLAAHETAKMAIALEALSGYSQSQGSADTLIINNRSKREILVCPISDFFNPFDPNIFIIENYNIDESYNRWVGSKKRGEPNLATTRIANLLARLHQDKISVSLQTNKLFQGIRNKS